MPKKIPEVNAFICLMEKNTLSIKCTLTMIVIACIYCCELQYFSQTPFLHKNNL